MNPLAINFDVSGCSWANNKAQIKVKTHLPPCRFSLLSIQWYAISAFDDRRWILHQQQSHCVVSLSKTLLARHLICCLALVQPRKTCPTWLKIVDRDVKNQSKPNIFPPSPCNFFMVCLHTHEDNPQVLTRGLSPVQVNSHCITILYCQHQYRPCTLPDIYNRITSGGLPNPYSPHVLLWDIGKQYITRSEVTGCSVNQILYCLFTKCNIKNVKRYPTFVIKLKWNSPIDKGSG